MKLPPFLSFSFESPIDPSRFYVYSIKNPDIKNGKFYIGISRHPQERIKKQLQTKPGLKDDFEKAMHHGTLTDPNAIPFEIAFVNPKGYPTAFLGCIAEVLCMVLLEAKGVPIYNQNKFGGHPYLKEEQKQLAFEAVVRVLTHNTLTEDHARALSGALNEIRAYILSDDEEDIIDSTFLKTLEDALKLHYGYKPTMADLLTGYRVLQPSNDNKAQLLLDFEPPLEQLDEAQDLKLF